MEIDSNNSSGGSGKQVIREDFSAAKHKLTAYFAPKKNTEYEIYKFRQAKQTSDETIDSFHTRLRQLAVNCEFTETSKEVKSQIIQGCHSTRLRRKALREDTTLEGLISSARALELSEKQATEIEQIRQTIRKCCEKRSWKTSKRTTISTDTNGPKRKEKRLLAETVEVTFHMQTSVLHLEKVATHVKS
ncbi:Hypothetical predicted protein [Mytilus galloprovincialis]|uniref:Retrotransposon gag domain-containing protein n=1 Tax=Mytilus galloprovincialis TaxID=29158 RepID=A0A8B6D242_MYTGA|nr:Hypothetical predicted protein [Mytilus galloprovincialis]